ncbi:MAG: aminoglycoside phosphotransferase family protein [Gammaproteobacteria bacterium]|nr:aminoglycoside phosphotransferase family protein [Gammaproteobacteria bacterium]
MAKHADSVAMTALRIAGHVLRERIRPHMAKCAGDVPSSVAVLTPEWWTAVMCAAHPDARVLSFDVMGESAGTHQRHRFLLSYNEAGHIARLPMAVFTKTLPNVLTRMIGGYNGTARAEGRFYQEIRPALAIEAPQGYHTAFDRDTLAGINVLEDIVTSRGARFCDAGTYVTRDMAESMVDLLAQLHAHAYDSARLTQQWRWLANFADWFEVGARKMGTEQYTRKALLRMKERVPARFVKRIDEVWPATVAASVIHRQGPRGLLHSDVHIGNWYRNLRGRMGLFDWQCVTQGHWSRDVAYALSAALTIEDRRAWERGLLARYLEVLCNTAGVYIDTDFAWKHYRAQMLHALWMWTITLCHSRWLPAMQPQATSMEMIQRIATAVDDLDSLNAATRG